jgi:hypothetical protein
MVRWALESSTFQRRVSTCGPWRPKEIACEERTWGPENWDKDWRSRACREYPRHLRMKMARREDANDGTQELEAMQKAGHSPTRVVGLFQGWRVPPFSWMPCCELREYCILLVSGLPPRIFWAEGYSVVAARGPGAAIKLSSILSSNVPGCLSRHYIYIYPCALGRLRRSDLSEPFSQRSAGSAI